MANKTKSIEIANFNSLDEMNSKIGEYALKYPMFEIYRNRKKSYYGNIYQIKAKGSIEAINDFLNSEKKKTNAPVQNIIDLLLKEMEPLRVMFMERTRLWAIGDFERISVVGNLTNDEVVEKYGKIIIVKNYKTGQMEKVKYADRSIKDWHYENKEIMKKGIEDYLEKSKKNAEEHYQNSIVKLANRINAKDLKVEKIVAKTKYSDIGVNIETILEDGEKIVRAWTIIASGAVQRPHYRYLVK